MARRKEGGFDLLASMPWPVGIVAGVLGFLAIRYGLGTFLAHAGGPMLKAAGNLGSMLAPLAWMLLGICWLASGFSFLGGRRRRRLLEIQTGLDSLAAMSWREFEMLVGEAFGRQGYAVEETGLGGPDGGVDLILRRDGRAFLLQCKQWRARQVNVSVVREMWGLVAHHGAGGAKIVCIGTFTNDAAAFAAGKPIELVTGEALLALVRSVQGTAGPRPAPVAAAAVRRAAPVELVNTPDCPQCGTGMIMRTNKKTGEPFWGCSSYPRCRGTMPA
jgi:restriction system protein